jgi:hypothetical protein
MNEMLDAYKRSEVFLEVQEEDPILKQREIVQNAMQRATPEQLERVLKMLGSPSIGDAKPASSL